MLLWQKVYIAVWASLTLGALATLVWRRSQFELTRRPYWRFLLRPWKVATFLVAWVGLVAFGPYSGDPTWDAIDASFMSILTFTTAPWVVGRLYRSLRQREAPSRALVAVIVWMFSASWSYDGYMVLKTGVYPGTWSSNIAASSVLYLSAGTLWSLEWSDERGVHLGFSYDDWPHRSPAAVFGKLLPFALAIMAPIGLAFLLFLL